MRTTLAILTLALAAFATPACRDASGADCDAGDLAYCCWDGDTTCAVESLCNPNNPDSCTPEPEVYIWHAEDDAEWFSSPCYDEDPALHPDCEGGA